MAHETNGATKAASTTCAGCGRPVGLLYIRGRSALVEARCEADGDRLIVWRHNCLPGQTQPPTPHPRKPR